MASLFQKIEAPLYIARDLVWWQLPLQQTVDGAKEAAKDINKIAFARALAFAEKVSFLLHRKLSRRKHHSDEEDTPGEQA